MASRAVPLSRGLEARVDAAMFDQIDRHKWSALVTKNGTAHAVRNDKEGGMVYLHRWLMNAGLRERIRFLDGDRLNCCRENLELVERLPKRRHLKSETRFELAEAAS